MNLLIFMNSLAGGGAERVAATLANHWVRQGWKVTLVTLEPASSDFHALDARVQRLSLDLAGDSANALHAVRHNLRRVLALRRLLCQVRPQVALSMMSTPNVLLALASRGMGGMVTVGSERCYPPHAPLGRMWHGLRRRLYGRLSALVALTGECAHWIGAHTSARRIAVIPNAVPWPLPDHAPRVPVEALCGAERKILLAVGRLDAVKNGALLIAVFARLAPRHPGWDLVMLGEGPQRAALEAAVAAHGLQGRVRLPGLAGNLGQWYGRADLFVLSSRSEGFPNALAEALAHGVPAVSFDCNTGPRDIVRHEIDGLLARPDDADALCAALARLMGDAALRRAYAARAVEARARFSIERITAMWEQLFDQLCGAGSRAMPAGAGSSPLAEEATRDG